MVILITNIRSTLRISRKFGRALGQEMNFNQKGQPKGEKNMKKISSILIALVLVVLVTSSALAYANSVTYSGQGLVQDWDRSYFLRDEICGVANGAEVDGPYLLWVLTATGAKNADISFFGGTPVAMTKFGNGTFKFVSGWYSPSSLSGNVVATYDGKVKNAQLTISHGCRPKQNGAWCSPGFWLNTLRFSPNAWNTIGVTPPGPYYNDVISDPFASGTPTLLDVLQDKSAYFSPTDQGAGFNAVGAYLTDQIPGYAFDSSLVGSSDACPLDAHGNFK